MAATTNPQTIVKYVILIGLLLTLPFITAHAQEIERDVSLPDSVMKQAVHQILSRHVKPPTKPQIVYVLDRLIRVEWLPRIKNVEFRIVKEDGNYASKLKNGYVFDRLRKEKGRFIVEMAIITLQMAIIILQTAIITGQTAIIALIIVSVTVPIAFVRLPIAFVTMQLDVVGIQIGSIRAIPYSGLSLMYFSNFFLSG